ncbi:hypothetical protein EYF80_026560 [Liparis tanakae]|uniref:Uncharacterized protein n=1 Tax=Liparis tanakae TaxID=230148 RepID=A0A4Z2HBF0_9TELE|nr:hypothetical protein EYF80_026560 [Liparis tanakae]
MHKGVWSTGAGDIGGRADPSWTGSTTITTFSVYVTDSLVQKKKKKKSPLCEHCAVEESDSHSWRIPSTGGRRAACEGPWARARGQHLFFRKREGGRKRGSYELIRGGPVNPAVLFPFSNPLRRWNEKPGRADLCVPGLNKVEGNE